ncbi:hypothetical protein ACFPIJ_01100 [Dactylosporangium cerinum]|uniref:Uncharacterized protein n=1 Tax=Dactylosporangium cerinum TaxID=1434730 RepID=A0ABV9VM64_9ACTN
MSDDYTPFTTDLDGDGVEDQAVIYTTDDGANVIVGDLDGNGEADFAALDEDGDGVYEQSYNALTGEYTDLTAEPADTADYDGSGGNLDGDISQYDTAADTETADTETADTETAASSGTGGYYDAAAVSDMMAMQHETNMAVINNI